MDASLKMFVQLLCNVIDPVLVLNLTEQQISQVSIFSSGLFKTFIKSPSLE